MVEGVVGILINLHFLKPIHFKSRKKNTLLAQTFIMVVCVRDCATSLCLPVTESCCWIEG